MLLSFKHRICCPCWWFHLLSVQFAALSGILSCDLIDLSDAVELWGWLKIRSILSSKCCLLPERLWTILEFIGIVGFHLFKFVGRCLHGLSLWCFHFKSLGWNICGNFAWVGKGSQNQKSGPKSWIVSIKLPSFDYPYWRVLTKVKGTCGLTLNRKILLGTNW